MDGEVFWKCSGSSGEIMLGVKGLTREQMTFYCK